MICSLSEEAIWHSIIKKVIGPMLECYLLLLNLDYELLVNSNQFYEMLSPLVPRSHMSELWSQASKE